MGQTAAQGHPGCRVFTLPVSAAWVYRWWGWVDLFASRLIAIRRTCQSPRGHRSQWAQRVAAVEL